MVKSNIDWKTSGSNNFPVIPREKLGLGSDNETLSDKIKKIRKWAI